MKTEQIQQIIDGAPEWAGHFDKSIKAYYEGDEELNIGLLKEILTLRKERDEQHLIIDHLRQLLSDSLRAMNGHPATKLLCKQINYSLKITNQTPTQSLSARDLEQQAKGVDDAVKALEGRKPFRPFKPDATFTEVWDNGWWSVFRELECYASKLRNQAKEEE